MRINTDGGYAWRTDLYDRVGEQLGENTRSGAIDGTCEFTSEMLANLKRAVDHPNMTEKLADVLSTSSVTLRYEIESEVQIGD